MPRGSITLGLKQTSMYSAVCTVVLVLQKTAYHMISQIGLQGTEHCWHVQCMSLNTGAFKLSHLLRAFLLPLQPHVTVPVELTVFFVSVAQVQVLEVLPARDLLPQTVHQLRVTAVGIPCALYPTIYYSIYIFLSVLLPVFVLVFLRLFLFVFAKITSPARNMTTI